MQEIKPLFVLIFLKETPVDEQVIQALYPTTLVDLTHRTIKSANRLHEYTILRQEYLETEIQKLSSVKPKENLWTIQ